jgi:hypothetical protein
VFVAGRVIVAGEGEGAGVSTLDSGIAAHELAMIPSTAAAMSDRIATASLGESPRASELCRGTRMR